MSDYETVRRSWLDNPEARLAEAQRCVAMCAEKKDPALSIGFDLDRLPEGISALTWLTELRMAGGRITDFSPLAPLSNLELLAIGSLNCPFPGLDFMSGWTRLQDLDIITPSAIDVKPLASCTMLKRLKVWCTQHRIDLFNFDALAGLKAVEHLSLYGTQSDRFDIISQWRHLRFVQLLRTNLTTLTGFENLDQLEYLSVSEAPVSDLSPLSALVALEGIAVDDTPVNDLSPLSNLPLLESLSLSGTQVCDLSPLSSLALLERLDISRTPVRDLSPLARLGRFQREFHRKKHETEPIWTKHGLGYLKIHQTNVTDVAPLAHLEELTSIYLGHTAVASIDPLRACKDLDSISMTKTEVRNLGPRGSFRHLRWLDASETRIEDLQALEPASELQWLNIAHTGISDLTPIQRAYECWYLNLRGSHVENLHTIMDMGSHPFDPYREPQIALDFRDTPASRINDRFAELAALANESTRKCFFETKAYLQETARPKRR